MTLASTVNRIDYTGNGAVDTYSYTFKIFDDDDLVVTVRDTSNVEYTLTKTTDYTVTGVGETAGGTIVLVDADQAWIDSDGDLTTGYIISIRRVRPLLQETDIRNQGTFRPEIHEDEFDKQVMIHQQHQDEIDRSLKLPESVDPDDFDTTLPVPTADRVLAVNAAGNGFTLLSTVPETSPLTTAGDLLVHNGTDPVRFPIGTDRQVLRVNTAATEKIQWTSEFENGNYDAILFAQIFS